MNQEELIEKILTEARTIAVVGLSPKRHRASYIVSEYLKEHGYNIIPVYPGEKEILGEKVYERLSDIKEKIDVVLIFRRSEEVLSVVQEAIKLKPKYIWMQLGITNKEAEELARKNGIEVVSNRCMKMEHSAL
ncbi:MAG: CoA-binding protein [Candidatus Goldbacteria bacterium]|nr:CoA-binding protein [Candidatus Goldiibacteriota bacterium]